MISHANVIANVLQYTTYESVGRKERKVETQVCLGLLPFSHIYALVVIVHGAVYRGDGAIVLPKFELPFLLKAIQDFKIEHMCLVSFLFPRDDGHILRTAGPRKLRDPVPRSWSGGLF